MTADALRGHVLFHCHTDWTDGQPSVGEYLAWAREAGVERVVFLEHIRRRPSYNVNAFVDTIRAESERHEVSAVVGFEAKVLPGGALDIAAEHAALADVIGIAEHGFPDDVELWKASLAQAFATWGKAEQLAVWVHPGLWLRKTGRLASHRAAYEFLIAFAQRQGVLVEQNQRYRLVPDDLVGAVHPALFVRGADAHRLAEANTFVAG